MGMQPVATLQTSLRRAAAGFRRRFPPYFV